MTKAQAKSIFMSFVKITDTCWIWSGNLDVDGYGLIEWLGKLTRAHRLAWQLFRGPIPKDKPQVLHHCDNPSCVRWDNDKHLFVGTHQDNMDDKSLKGRVSSGASHGKTVRKGYKARSLALSGEKHVNAKLTDEDVVAIYKRYHIKKELQSKLAFEFNVSQACVSTITLKQRRYKFTKGIMK